MLKLPHLNGDIYCKCYLNLNMTNYLGRLNTMYVFHFWSLPKQNLGYVPFYRFQNKEHFRKDIAPSLVTHWNLVWPHLFDLPSLTNMSSRGGRREWEETPSNLILIFFFLPSHSDALVWGEKMKNMSRISKTGILECSEENSDLADSIFQFSFPLKIF